MEEQEVVRRWVLEYCPVTYKPRATQYTFIGTYDELEKWFEETLVCGQCREDNNLLREYSNEDEDCSPFNTGCGCEWDIISREPLNKHELEVGMIQ